MRLATKRLVLLSRAPKDRPEETIKTMVSWLNDPENTRYSEQRHKKHNMDTQRSYLGRFIGKNNRLAEISYGNDLVGTITARIDAPNSVANIGILIGKKFWGEGFGAEAWAAFCDHLLDNGVRKVEAGMMANNFGMIGICRKYGMIHEGRRYDRFLFEGTLVDETHFGKGR